MIYHVVRIVKFQSKQKDDKYENSNGIDNTFIQMDELNNNSDETESNKLVLT